MTPSSRRVVVTGIGLVTPLGCGSEHVWRRLLQGDCGVSKLDTDYGLPCSIAGVVQSFPSVLDLRERSRISRDVDFALTASEEALKGGSWLEQCDLNAFGVSIGTGMGDLSQTIDGYNDFKQRYRKLSPFFVPKVLQNMSSGQIAIHYGLRGPNHCVMTACAAGAHSIGDSYRFIKDGYADCMLAGGTEASIHPLSIAGFVRCKALATKFNDSPELASRPFDRQRDGFVMSEGAAVLLLEELTHAQNRNAQVFAEIIGYGLSGDAHHITAPDPDGDGAFRTMKMAVERASRSVCLDEIGYVNAHATATGLGDIAEAKGIYRLFDTGTRQEKLHVSSTKGSTGHLLGAAGAVEAAFTVLALYNSRIPATLNLENLDILGEEVRIQEVCNFVTKEPITKTNLKYALSNSFGFGGTNASLLFARYDKGEK